MDFSGAALAMFGDGLAGFGGLGGYGWWLTELCFGLSEGARSILVPFILGGLALWRSAALHRRGPSSSLSFVLVGFLPLLMPGSIVGWTGS